MDKIIDRLKKLLALAERGYQGEAENARRILEAELQKHGLKLEDITLDKRTLRVFSYYSNEERTLLIQIIFNYLGSKNDVVNAATYNKYEKKVFIDLTDLEFVDISNMYAFHKAHYRKERKRLLDEMIAAYVSKHKIYDATPSEDTSEEKEIDMERLWRIMAMQNSMDDVTYRKALTE